MGPAVDPLKFGLIIERKKVIFRLSKENWALHSATKSRIFQRIFSESLNYE